MVYKIGTRGSALAIAQTKSVVEALKQQFPEDEYEIVVIKTTGDKNQTVALDQIGAKGIFTDEIEKALLNDEIQMAVHSMKDMPSEETEGLIFADAWKREDPRDVLILRDADSLNSLPKGAVIATGSKRREVQLKRLRPDIKTVGIRGNIDTRIRKLFDPSRGLDGIVLAAAGLHRLGLQDKITSYFSVEDMIPAPCQGTLAIQLREDNRELLEKVNSLSDADTKKATEAERAFLASTGGNCHLPIGAYLDTETNVFYSIFGNEEGTKLDIKKQDYVG